MGKNMGKHEDIVSVVNGVLVTQKMSPVTNVVYNHGEIDVLCDKIYYEVKVNMSDRNVVKAIDQISRAVKYGKARYGYLVTHEGVYDVLREQMIKVG